MSTILSHRTEVLENNRYHFKSQCENCHVFVAQEALNVSCDLFSVSAFFKNKQNLEPHAHVLAYLIWFLFYWYIYFWDRVSHCTSGCPGTHSNPPYQAFFVQGLKKGLSSPYPAIHIYILKKETLKTKYPKLSFWLFHLCNTFEMTKLLWCQTKQ